MPLLISNCPPQCLFQSTAGSVCRIGATAALRVRQRVGKETAARLRANELLELLGARFGEALIVTA